MDIDENVNRCVDCLSPMPAGAAKCVECKSYQDFRRYLNNLSLMIGVVAALLSVVGIAVPLIIGVLPPKPANLESTNFNLTDGELSILVSNSGGLPTAISKAIFYIAADEDTEAQDKVMVGLTFIPQGAVQIAPLEIKTIAFQLSDRVPFVELISLVHSDSNVYVDVYSSAIDGVLTRNGTSASGLRNFCPAFAFAKPLLAEIEKEEIFYIDTSSGTSSFVDVSSLIETMDKAYDCSDAAAILYDELDF